MPSSRADFQSGVRDVLPVLPGFVPFGIITGLAAVKVGLTDVQAVGMSAMMFSGAAQLAALELLGQSAPLGVIVATALMINLRFSMFSAAVAPYLQSLSLRWKWLSGYLLSTPSFVLSVAKFEEENPPSRRWYYLGTAFPVWASWQLSTLTGIVLGARIPDGLQLDFVIPLVFMALLFELLDARAARFVAVGAGVVAVSGATLPLNMGLFLATFVGVSVGLVVERRMDSS